MKKVLIISPYFPPFNTADMQRIRQSLPYFRENGWEPTIITVDEKYVEAYSKDDLLLKTIPDDVRIYKVKAWKTSITRIGSLSIRSFFSIRRKGDELLRNEKFDLVYFTTTAFHVMALGPRWKKKFGVPFVLDIQDPWYNEYFYQNSLHKKTIKRMAYHRLDKYLERKTMPFADGIISVSPGYKEMYLNRYNNLQSHQFEIIPFGCVTMDFQIAKEYVHSSDVRFETDKINMVYIGRGGLDMRQAVEIIFDAVKVGLESQPALFQKLHLWFIGTDYAPAGTGKKSIEPIAHEKGLTGKVTEITDRLPYFETLYLLAQADLLFVPGSNDATYTASKIYPYIYLAKPMVSIFHEKSSVCQAIRSISKTKLITFDDHFSDAERKNSVQECYSYLSEILQNKIKEVKPDYTEFEKFTARSMTARQTNFFNLIIGNGSPAKLVSGKQL